MLQKKKPIQVNYYITKRLGLAKAILISFLLYHIKDGRAINMSARALTEVIPLSKSTISKAINELVTDTYINTEYKGYYALTTKFFTDFKEELKHYESI